MIFRRLPLRGSAWLLAQAPLGGVVVILSPKFYLQILRWGDTFIPPDWISWRIK